ncbi:MAG TPA: ATP-binding cassette domain-containing protein [Burkholderiales bacterium]|nr:ATP-binding cassette domain-containing protein [Burkholderiales bacterium]
MVTLENVSKSYAKRVALQPVSLEFVPGETSVLIGPSGCGKSTLLRMVVGLIHPDSGRVLVNGEVLAASNVEHLRHAMGYVIQDGGLFPHLTAADNVTLLGRHLGMDAGRMGEQVKSLAELVSIPADALNRYPQQLSGGQRQRIALMRALMMDPPLLLLDEPLGALDPVTRYQLQDDLKSIFQRLGKTVILVTHDMAEAAHFGSDIVMMREGRVVQRGAFDDFLSAPAEPYVAQFVRAQRVAGITARP